MRIGVMLGGARAAPPLSELTRRTRDLEARGFDTLWLPGVGDRTYKLASGTTSEYGRYVEYPGGAP